MEIRTIIVNLDAYQPRSTIVLYSPTNVLEVPGGIKADFEYSAVCGNYLRGAFFLLKKKTTLRLTLRDVSPSSLSLRS